MSPSGAPDAPFADPRRARPPGVQPLDPVAWVALDPDYAPQMAERDRLLADTETRARAVLALPEAAPAVDEFRAALLAHLAAREGWRDRGRTIQRPDNVRVSRDLDALDIAGRLTQEDWLLLLPGELEHRLVAGVLLFPARWRLDEKLGRPLTAVHAPVPGYAAALAPRVNRIFAGLRPNRPLARANWQVHATPRLDQPQREADSAPRYDIENGLWLRVERQTLARLPQTGVVVFGVKTTVTPLEDLTPPQAEALAAALRERDEAEIAYTGGRAVHEAALAALAAAPPSITSGVRPSSA